MLVCIEGIDASGKHTQSVRLARRHNAELFSFPEYQSPTGLLIAGFLHEQWSCGDLTKKEAALVLQSLMAANRMELARRLLTAIRAQTNVVLDRYWPSGVVYGGCDGLDHQYLMDLHYCLPRADTYILLDVPPVASVDRRPDRRDRYEKEPGLMARAAKRYRELWVERANNDDKSAWIVVNGMGSVEEVAERIDGAVHWGCVVRAPVL